MGYYSNFDIEKTMGCPDRSYPAPEEQMLWRVEDLQARLEELTVLGAPIAGSVCRTEDDLRFILPGTLECTADVVAALELAKDDLLDRYGVDLYAENRQFSLRVSPGRRRKEVA